MGYEYKKTQQLKRLADQQGKKRQIQQKRAAPKIQQQFRIHITKQSTIFVIFTSQQSKKNDPRKESR